jgi:hypothetical protein
MAVVSLRPRNTDIVLGAAALALGWMGLRASDDGEFEAETQARLDQSHQGRRRLNKTQKQRKEPCR